MRKLPKTVTAPRAHTSCSRTIVFRPYVSRLLRPWYATGILCGNFHFLRPSWRSRGTRSTGSAHGTRIGIPRVSREIVRRDIFFWLCAHRIAHERPTHVFLVLGHRIYSSIRSTPLTLFRSFTLFRSCQQQRPAVVVLLTPYSRSPRSPLQVQVIAYIVQNNRSPVYVTIGRN